MKPLSLLLLLAAPLHAGPRTSASYTVPTDSADAAGRRTTSASYTHDGSAGGITGLSTAAAPAETARSGYIGQLYEAKILSLSATPMTLNEGGTRQLNATLLLDDSTSVALAGNAVSWTVQSGPLTVNTSGLVTAAAVFQDGGAVVQGLYATLTRTLGLTVLNALPDNFGTYAGDGLADDWQVQYFGLNNSNAAPALDPDGDGQDNLFEYNACLIPTDPLSFLTMNITSAAGGGHNVTFFPRNDGCTYTLTGTSDLSLWAPLTDIISGAGNVRIIHDPAGNGPRRFYRLNVQRD